MLTEERKRELFNKCFKSVVSNCLFKIGNKSHGYIISGRKTVYEYRLTKTETSMPMLGILGDEEFEEVQKHIAAGTLTKDKLLELITESESKIKRKLTNDDWEIIWEDLEDGDLEYLAKFAKGGDADAQNAIALEYYIGEHVPVDETKALYWFEQAAQNGHVYAMSMAGQSYEFGYGVEPDKDKAIEYYIMAARTGDDIYQEFLRKRGINWEDNG